MTHQYSDPLPEIDEIAEWLPNHLNLPEHALVIAVLSDGIYRALRANHKDRDWVFKPELQSAIFSFTNCCDILEICPDKLKRIVSTYGLTETTFPVYFKPIHSIHRTIKARSVPPIKDYRFPVLIKKVA